jgi:hypothetical protein
MWALLQKIARPLGQFAWRIDFTRKNNFIQQILEETQL